MERNKKRDTILSIIVVLIIILMVVGVTYAYFAGVLINDATPQTIASDTVSLIYTDCGTNNGSGSANNHCQLINASLKPGESVEKTFKVQNTSSTATSFNLYFRRLLNTFTNNELVYKIEDVTNPNSPTTVVAANTPVPYKATEDNNVIITANNSIAYNTTREFKMTITFVNQPDIDQSYNASAEFLIQVGIDEYIHRVYLSSYIISQYGPGSNIYYHTTDTTKYQNGEGSISSTNASSQTDTYANLNAGDGSYRYSGASASVNNYICFGTDNETTCKTDTSNNGTSKYLYRIIGVFDGGNGNKVTKIVLANPLYNSATSAATYRWDYNGSTFTNEWSNASLKQWLNGETLKSGSESYYPATKFLSNYSSAWTNKIAPSTWYVRGFMDETKNTKGIYTDEIANVKNGVSGYTKNYQGNSATLTNTKVGLEYISDYMYAASPTYWNYPGYSSSGATYDYRAASSANWLFTGVMTWTISPSSSGTGIAWGVDTSGRVRSYGITYMRAVLPVVYLASDIEIDTSATNVDGSASHPYILRAE